MVQTASADLRPLLVCALSTGMRKGEIQTLTWASVDLERRFLTVEPENNKVGKARTIPLSAWLEEVLRPMAPPAGTPHAKLLVFRTVDGHPLNDWQLRKRLDPAIEACDAIPAEKKPKISMHVLRHTAASLMVAAGVPIFDVAKVLGHATLAVTMRYAHFAPAAGRSAIDALDRTLRPDGAPSIVAEGLVPYVRSPDAGEAEVRTALPALRLVRDSA